MKKRVKNISIILLILCITGIGILHIIDAYVISEAKGKIINIETAKEKEFDCIIVLGAGLKTDGTPSLMLKDRLDKSIELYKNDIAHKIIMSGDHGEIQYDEVNAMKEYAISRGIPSDDIFMDHAGFSTYDSIYRAKEVFLVSRTVIVTQEYHIFRALYIAEKLDLNAYGISAKEYNYGGQDYREWREKLARVKDYIYTIAKPKPVYLGETIDVLGDGNQTNDKL